VASAQPQADEPADRPPEEVAESLRRLISGDPRAAAWLYDAFAPRLYRRLRGRYGHLPGIDAEDLLQSAFLFYLQNDCRVLRGFLEDRPAAEVTSEALLRRLWDLACGLASNQRRAARARPATTDLGEAPAETGPTIERRLSERQTLSRLAACLANRGRRLYLYFCWRYGDGLTPREIADVAGWTRHETYRLREALNRALAACAASLGIDLG
jgi:DNA-directed RNA polymerase specialized sigma24 family protein